MSDEARRVLDEIGGDWSLVRPLGGAQQGAWLIASGIDRAVLKWHARDDMFCNEDAPAVVAYLREQGYPTPEWLDWGVLDTGSRYWIQEFVEAAPLKDLNLDNVDYFIDIVERQRGLTPPTSAAWTAYVHQKVPGSKLLSPTDVVHGDLSVGNVLVDFRGRVTVVDIEAAARGCAAYDLMAPAANGVYWRSDPDAVSRLVDHAFAVYDADPVITSATCVVADCLERYGRGEAELNAWLDALRSRGA